MQPHEQEETPSLAERGAQYIAQHQKTLLTLLVLLLIAAVMASYFYQQTVQKDRKTLFAYENSLRQLNTLPYKDQLDKTYTYYQKLRSPYGAPYIHQMALATLHPLKDNIPPTSLELKAFPLYQDYRQTTLLLEQEKWEEASKKAIKLHENMRKNPGGQQQVFGLFLYSYNLMRIAFLNQKLNKPQLELAAWEDLEMALYGKNKILESGFFPANNKNKLQDAFQKVFGKSQGSLKDYIKSRKADIAKKT